jgi:hypothetical protein
MEKLSREYIKKLIYEALGRGGGNNSNLSKTRVKEVIQEEIVKRYGDK